jgi:hypothetical protein
LYHEQLHVPLIISGEGISPKVLTERVGTQDILPTIASWRKNEKEIKIDGIDLMSGTIPERAFVSETSRFRSCRLSMAKEGYRLEWDLKNKKTELFSEADFLEEHDLSKKDPDRVELMQQELLTQIGFRWETRLGGMITASYIWDGVGLNYGKREVKPGDRFTIFPFDHSFYFRSKKESSTFLNAMRPDKDSPLVYLGSDFVGIQSLESNVEKLLQELGYMQED